MLKRPWFVFLVGLLCGALIIAFAWFASTMAAGFSTWGKPQVYFDDLARKAISQEALIPSPSAKDVYFYIDGFQDHRVFIAFTDSPERIDKAVLLLTGKLLLELDPWAQQIETESYREPGTWDKNYLTSLYDIDSITRGRFYEVASASGGWHVIVDEVTNRLYYCCWNN